MDQRYSLPRYRILGALANTFRNQTCPGQARATAFFTEKIQRKYPLGTSNESNKPALSAQPADPEAL